MNPLGHSHTPWITNKPFTDVDQNDLTCLKCGSICGSDEVIADSDVPFYRCLVMKCDGKQRRTTQADYDLLREEFNSKA